MNKQYRHGDVFLQVVEDDALKGANPLTTAVVARGEVTGHSHTMVAPNGETPISKEKDFELFERDGKLYLRTGPRGAAIVHQEHARIDLPANTAFSITIQREWSPEGNRKVVD